MVQSIGLITRPICVVQLPKPKLYSWTGYSTAKAQANSTLLRHFATWIFILSFFQLRPLIFFFLRPLICI